MKIKILILFTSVILINFGFGQTRISIHQEHEQEFGKLHKNTIVPKGDIADIIPIKNYKSSNLTKAVFGFLPYWEYSRGAHTNVRYKLLSHIAVFDFKASQNGNISNPRGWPWTDVINAAHNEGTKVIMVISNFKKNEINRLMTNNTSKNSLFNNIKNTITTYKLDGVNIDFEGLDKNDRGDILNNFMLDLKNYIHTHLPGKEVSFDGPAVNWGDWKLKELVENIDYLMLMAYDYNGRWSAKTGPVAPLTSAIGGICVERTLNRDYGDAIASHPDKIILGVPYYGKEWKTETDTPRSTVTSYVGTTFYRSSEDDAATKGGFLLDANSNSSWYKWEDTNGWNQVWADNEDSLEKKYDMALSKNLKGIGIWALNYDGNKTKLWDLIDTKFSNTLSNDDVLRKNGIHLAPNPTQKFITITNPNSIKIAYLDIYNLYGQHIKRIKSPKNEINTEELGNSIYLFKLTDENNNQETFKVLKL